MKGMKGDDMADWTKFKESVAWYDANRDSLLAQYRGKFLSCRRICGSWLDVSPAGSS